MRQNGLASKFCALVLAVLTIAVLQTGCAGKYVINSYPSGAKVYIKDVQTKEKQLLGVTPLAIKEQSNLGDVFFVEFEKENYFPKEVMVKVNAGESLTLTSRLDPLNPERTAGTDVAKKENDQKPQPQPNKDDQKKKDWQLEIDDLKLRVALLENTSNLQKEAIFSARFKGGPAQFDRDDQDRMVGWLFETQQAIMKGQYDKASALLDKAIQTDEYSANAWMLKGSVSYLQKDYPGARKAWERTLKIDPYNKSAYKYLAEVYKRMGVNELPAQGPQMRYPSSQIEIEKRQKR